VHHLLVTIGDFKSLSHLSFIFSTDYTAAMPDIEDHDLKAPTYDTDPRIHAYTLAEQRRIYRRIDIRLVVTLGCMYMISLLDRTNLGAASVAGYVPSSVGSLANCSACKLTSI
jgi:hypothetical protein